MAEEYPLGTIVYYGPDDTTTTKIVASVITDREADPLQKTYHGAGVTLDPTVIAEIGRFFTENRVKKVVMTDRNIGCEHEEGIDYPLGETCPYCPFWAAKS